jgi:hypothetical protein
MEFEVTIRDSGAGFNRLFRRAAQGEKLPARPWFEGAPDESFGSGSAGRQGADHGSKVTAMGLDA